MHGGFFMIVGQVDTLANGKVYGWAFNSDNQAERLQISIARGAQTLAAGMADLFREDLPDAGIGDGKHAFAIAVPPDITSLQGLSIAARSSTAGETALPIATSEEQRLDELFQGFSQRYDDLLVDMKDEIESMRRRGDDGAGNVELRAEFEARLAKVEKRLEDFEVFILRLDEITRKLQERAGLSRPGGMLARLLKRFRG